MVGEGSNISHILIWEHLRSTWALQMNAYWKNRYFFIETQMKECPTSLNNKLLLEVISLTVIIDWKFS